MSRHFLFGLVTVASVALAAIPAQAWGHHIHGRIVRYSGSGVYIAGPGGLVFVPFGSQFFLNGQLITIGGPGAYGVGTVLDASYGPGDVYSGYSGGSYYSPNYRRSHGQGHGYAANRGGNRGGAVSHNGRGAQSGQTHAAPGGQRGGQAHAAQGGQRGGQVHAAQGGQRGAQTHPAQPARTQQARPVQGGGQRGGAPAGGAHPQGGGAPAGGGHPAGHEGGEHR